MNTGAIYSAAMVSIWLAATPALQAQSRASHGSLRVTVTDPTGAVIIGARVLLVGEGAPSTSIATDERGQAVFSALAPGRYGVRVESDGFESASVEDLRVRSGETRREVRLALGKLAEEITVGRDGRESRTDPRGDSFASVLTPDQIAQLPDDPDEFEDALRQMAGPGAVMRVNGFRGGRLPQKNQISQIRFRRNFYAADTHETGFASVDIITKPGASAWRGSTDIALRDGRLNARNAFAPRPPDEEQQRYAVSIDGPLWKNHTSLSFATDGLDASETKTVRAAVPDGTIADQIRRPTERMNFSARIEHALSGTHALRGELQQGRTEGRNLGVGDYELSERAFSRQVDQTVFRLSESGPIGRRLFNELRFQASWDDTSYVSAINRPTIQVLNAFTSGGAQIEGGRRAREFEIADNLDVATRRHAMRFGFLFEAGRYRSDERRNAAGTYIFPSLDAYVAGTPTTFTRRDGDPMIEFSQYQLGWYAQDDIRLRKDLTLSVGVRQERQSHLKDRLNISPRVGFVWSPFRSGKTTFRGGAGVFHDWYDAAVYEQTLRVDGTRQRDFIVRNPGFPDPLDGGTSLVLPPSRLVQDPSMRMPALATGSIGVERQLAAMTMVSATWFYSRGWNQLRGRNLNAPGADGLRPAPSAGNITQIESTAGSSANRLSISFNMNVPARQWFVATNYLLARETNEADGPFSLPADNLRLDAERGPAPGDIRHRWVGMFNMGLWKGFRVGASFRLSSAAPYTITTGFDDNGDTVSNDRPSGVGRNSARGSGAFDMGGRIGWGRGFGTRAPSGGGPVPVVRIVRAGDMEMPGAVGPVGAPENRIRLEIFAAASNLMNHTNLQNYSGVMASPFFGQATAAGPARRVEFGARIMF